MEWSSNIRVIVSAAVLGLLGCSLEDSLLNAPCDGDDDCVGRLRCVRTEHQAAVGLAGWCRDDDGCAVGQQEGCRAQGTTCERGLAVVVDPGSGNGYCCDDEGGSREPTLTRIAADESSAQCVLCSEALCDGEADATEVCDQSQPRCAVTQGVCGCRIPDNRLENSECDDDATCGEGFVCTRTLEQAAEPDDINPEERAEEPGWCRPSGAPECVGGQQKGCRNEGSSCSEGIRRCAGARCYCCDGADNSSEFSVHVYAETELGESAACIECERRDCPESQTCTRLEDESCVPRPDSVCGCTPVE